MGLLHERDTVCDAIQVVSTSVSFTPRGSRCLLSIQKTNHIVILHIPPMHKSSASSSGGTALVEEWIPRPEVTLAPRGVAGN